jgi:hypothetical protein
VGASQDTAGRNPFDIRRYNEERLLSAPPLRYPPLLRHRAGIPRPLDLSVSLNKLGSEWGDRLNVAARGSSG